MMIDRVDGDEHFEVSKFELQMMLDEAGEKGAQAALLRLGLHDEQAPKDISELRDLLDAWRSARRTVWSSIWRTVTVAVLTAIASYVYIKHGVGE